MKITREDMINQFDQHCKSKYPREFGKKKKKGFERNDKVNNPEVMFNLARFFGYWDCYNSVYSFAEWDYESEKRKKFAVIDTIVFDLDSENDLGKAFREARKLVKYLQEEKDTIPRVYFSGGKGFHVYADFEPIELKNPWGAIKNLGYHIANKLELKTYDSKVWEPARVIRLPLTKHGKTKYRCTPIKPELLFKLDLTSLLRFCKYNYSDIEVHESESIKRLLKFQDFKAASMEALNRTRPQRIQRTTTGSTRLNEKKLQKIITALIPYYQKGNRQDTVMGLSALLYWRGVPKEDTEKVIEALCDYTGDDEKLRRKTAIESTYSKGESGKRIGYRNYLSESCTNVLKSIIYGGDQF